MPARAGSAICTSMSPIMPATSTSTVWPSSTWSVSGMVTGERTVETRRVARPSETSPPNMPIHMVETTATGTEYSSTMPSTRLGLPPKRSVARANATRGMATVETRSVTSMGAGCAKVRPRLERLFPSAPWKVMNAKSGVTHGLRKAS